MGPEISPEEMNLFEILPEISLEEMSQFEMAQETYHEETDLETFHGEMNPRGMDCEACLATGPAMDQEMYEILCIHAKRIGIRYPEDPL
mmetsp:Transcript_27888/g.61427  ORF Transcript_27888/g.61427 Transcript_27888/m.61427 type:complete len:89 (+) Transcript_27888:830-1096(+)